MLSKNPYKIEKNFNKTNGNGIIVVVFFYLAP